MQTFSTRKHIYMDEISFKDIVVMSPRAFLPNDMLFAVSFVNGTVTKQIDACDMERILCEVESFIFPSEKDVESKMIFFL